MVEALEQQCRLQWGKAHEKQVCQSNGNLLHKAANILDLPNELLLDILVGSAVLSQRDLLNISFLSTRFRSVALPIFLANHGILDPERETSFYVIEWNPNSVRVATRPDALSGLAHLTTLSKVDRLRCFFQDADNKTFRNTFQQASNLPYAITRVAKFVQTLKHVETAEIYLIWDPYFVNRERSSPYVPMAEIRRWTNAFGYLLNLLVVRGCSSLTIQYSAAFEPAFQFKSVNAMRKAFSYLSHNVLHRDGQPPQLEWELQRPLNEGKSLNKVVESPTFPSSSVASKRIASLSIHSPVLLLPPFTNWTLSLLRAHPQLSSISFAYIPISKDLWAILLPFIADALSDKLTRLSFFKGCPDLDVADLLHFLSHLPNLQFLYVDRTFRPRLEEFRKQRSLITSLTPNHCIPAFPRLHTLRSPVEFVSLVLDSRSAKDSVHIALPNLKDLTVFPSSRLIHPPSYIASSIAVNSLIDRVSSQAHTENIVFTLDAQTDFTDFVPVIAWIQSIKTQSKFRRSVLESLADSDVQQLAHGGQIPLIAFKRIKRLVLYRFEESRPNQTVAKLCLWLKLLFPSLERLSFTCALEASPAQNIQIDVATVKSLIEELARVCPNVRVLVVGQKTYDLQVIP